MGVQFVSLVVTRISLLLVVSSVFLWVMTICVPEEMILWSFFNWAVCLFNVELQGFFIYFGYKVQ